MLAERHNFEVGRWVRLLKGPHVGKRGLIVARRGDELEILINGGPEHPLSVTIADVQKALVNLQSHGNANAVVSDSRRG
jgi:hypothetical protein